MSRQHTSADRARSHAAGQRKITHTCQCGRVLHGNAAWWSHSQACTARNIEQQAAARAKTQ